MKIFELLFGCKHDWSKPITPFSTNQIVKPRTYKVCLECGRERFYNWQTMKMEEERKVVVPNNLSSEKLLKELEGDEDDKKKSAHPIIQFNRGFDVCGISNK